MKFFHPPHLYYVTTLPRKTNTTATIISVLSVFFYWLHLSLDSIKMMCGCSSQVAMLDVSAAILDTRLKTLTPFIDTVINETLWEFLPLGKAQIPLGSTRLDSTRSTLSSQSSKSRRACRARRAVLFQHGGRRRSLYKFSRFYALAYTNPICFVK